jgi:hypothetical protein
MLTSTQFDGMVAAGEFDNFALSGMDVLRRLNEAYLKSQQRLYNLAGSDGEQMVEWLNGEVECSELQQEVIVSRLLAEILTD